jgi:hypothetical protein
MKKKSRKKNVLVLRRPEDDAIPLFAGLLANPDVPLSHGLTTEGERCTAKVEGKGEGGGRRVGLREKG